MGREWSIRAYQSGDEEGMFELESAVYGKIADKDLWMRRWKWMFQANPAGAPVIWFAESNGKLVGQYPVNRMKMKIGNEILNGSQMMALMTHPDYQRQGIFLALAKQALSDAGSKGFDITYGFPNKLAFPGHIKSGYSDVGAISAMIKLLNCKNILRKYITNRLLLEICAVSMSSIIRLVYRTGKAPNVDALTITRVSSFDERINDLWEKVSNDYEIMVVRDKEYLNWRFVDIPDVDYAIYLAEKEGQILGYTVLRCEKQFGLKVGRIFELVVPLRQEQVAQALILKAIEFFKEERVDLVIYRMIGSRAYHKVLRKGGFIYSHLASRNVRMIAHPNTSKISQAFLGDSRNWFLQTGDSDAI